MKTEMKTETIKEQIGKESINPNQIGEGPLTEEQQIYKENILDHYRNPHHKGTLSNTTLTHTEHNPLCGDMVTMHLMIKNNQITDVKFDGHGCTISQASASMLTDKLQEMTLDKIKKITRDEIMEMIGVPLGPVRSRCALLALRTVIKGLENLQ